MAEILALEMKEISKSFGGVKALKKVNFNAYKGKVNVLMGENGAGKSTLMKVLAGAIERDAGEIFIDGNRVRIDRPQDSMENGVAMIYQELNLVPTMTVEANMNLGKERVRRLGFVQIRDSVNAAQKLLDSYNLEIDARAEVRDLSIAQGGDSSPDRRAGAGGKGDTADLLGTAGDSGHVRQDTGDV